MPCCSANAFGARWVPGGHGDQPGAGDLAGLMTRQLGDAGGSEDAEAQWLHRVVPSVVRHDAALGALGGGQAATSFGFLVSRRCAVSRPRT